MKLVANLRLKPTPEQRHVLRDTLERCNEACNWLSAKAFDSKTFRQYDLHKLCYKELRSRFSLTAQVAVRCVAKVADAYKIGRDKPRVFRKYGAQPYDERILRFCADDIVSIWLLDGRNKIAYVCGDHQRGLLAHRKGEVDLMFVRGKWYLACVCDFDDPGLLTPKGMLGVDFGIVNIASDSLGNQHSGSGVEAYRKRYASRRAALQRVGTRAARKRLRRMSGKQRRFHKHTNHCISKSIVATAERYGYGIVLEDLKHIRARVKANKELRKRLHNWSFGQLRAFVEYKAKRARLPVLVTNPAYTSQTCPACGVIDRANRASQSVFRCRACGHVAHADTTAARNLAGRATVTKPMFAHACVPRAVESPVL